MLVAATMAKYDQMFDDMDEIRKAESIVSISSRTRLDARVFAYLFSLDNAARHSTNN